MTREFNDHISRQRRTGRNFLKEFLTDIFFESIWIGAALAAIALVVSLTLLFSSIVSTKGEQIQNVGRNLTGGNYTNNN